MYDFLLVAPHGNASHSLIEYLNQHPRMRVGPSFGIKKPLDVARFEEAYRPWMNSLGIASKYYNNESVAEAVLKNVKRDVFIQTVRDPIEAFISFYRNEELSQTLYRLLNRPTAPIVAEHLITRAVEEFITPSIAEEVFQFHTFKSHIVIDVLDMKGGQSEAVVKRLWRLLDGDDNVPNAVYKPLGSAPFHMLRVACLFFAKLHNIQMRIALHFDGDLLLGQFDLEKGTYFADEICLATYPDALQVLPELGVAGPLHVRTDPLNYFSIPPGIREGFLSVLKPKLEQTLRDFNAAYAEAKAAMSFSLDRLTADQRAMLRAGVEPDYVKFATRHPEITARWNVTRAFLGIHQ